MRGGFFGLVVALGLACSVSLASSARATEYSVGLGSGIAPDYIGSDNYEFVPLWNLAARDLYHPETYVRLDGPWLYSNLLPSNNWRLGVSGQIIFGRKDVENNAVDRMENIDETFMLGVMGGYDFKLSDGSTLGLELNGRYDVQDEIGGLLTMKAKFATRFGATKKWRLGTSVESSYATDDYMETYFGVDAADAARSGLSTYSADAGFRDVTFNAALTYYFTPAWSVAGLFKLQRLIGDADDSSPVVDVGSENNVYGGVLVGFHF